MKKVIHTDLAPAAIGPYSQAIQCGDFIYLSGQIPLDPQTMLLCSEDIKLQIEQVFHNIRVVTQAAGASLEHIVKLTVYLVDLSHFSLVNDAMLRYFKEPYPARVAIGVASLPKGSQVEVDAILHLP
jgi:reactive intermediate/imine deaminase